MVPGYLQDYFTDFVTEYAALDGLTPHYIRDLI